MIAYETNNELMHYGVLGMKWGVRRARKTAKSSKKSRNTKDLVNYDVESYSEDYKKAHSKKNLKTMSDQELRDRLNRLNMEKQYKQITGASISKGKVYTDKAIKALGTLVTVSGAIVTLYNNADKIKRIIKK